MYNCCYNCNNAILGDDSSRDCPPTFYGCMLGKDESIHKKGFGNEMDCFVYGKQTEEWKKQKENKMWEIIEEGKREYEIAELARLKEKYETYINNQIVYKTNLYKKQNIGLVLETLEEAKMFIKSNFPNAQEITSKQWETDMFKIFYITPYINGHMVRFNHLYTTKEIEQSEWFKSICNGVLTAPLY